MTGTEFLADTNAIIYLLKGNACMKPYLDTRIALSVISYMELLSFSGITQQEERSIRAFTGMCRMLPIDNTIIEQTIKLRRQYRIKLPDAIIAATALSYELPLITADSGFDHIDELKVERLLP